MAAGLCVSVVWQSLVCGLLWVCGDGLLGGVGVLHYIYIYLYIYHYHYMDMLFPQ